VYTQDGRYFHALFETASLKSSSKTCLWMNWSTSLSKGSHRAIVQSSYCSCFHELQKLRGVGRIFEGKEGFATLRDLFRWAGRDAKVIRNSRRTVTCFLRSVLDMKKDKKVVKDVIENIMKVKINEEGLYNIQPLDLGIKLPDGLVWTKPMRRLSSFSNVRSAITSLCFWLVKQGAERLLLPGLCGNSAPSSANCELPSEY